jgi:hypothetical protein
MTKPKEEEERTKGMERDEKTKGAPDFINQVNLC